MKLSIRRTVAFATILGTLALSAGVALADQGQGARAGHHHGHHDGLIAAALKLDSLTPEQRTSVEQLAQARRDAGTLVRQADARVLTELAHQVEQATIDAAALQPSLSAEQTAATAQAGVEKDTLMRLHGLLTPAQRDQLVSAFESRHPHRDGGFKHHEGDDHGGKLGLTPEQRKQIHAALQAEHVGQPGQGGRAGFAAGRTALESFRGDAFDPSPLVRVEARGEHAERLAKAMVPVLSAEQRATFAGELRSRATREQR